jgi:hypothetical protein
MFDFLLLRNRKHRQHRDRKSQEQNAAFRHDLPPMTAYDCLTSEADTQQQV